jgi:hypothetical protein
MRLAGLNVVLMSAQLGSSYGGSATRTVTVEAPAAAGSNSSGGLESKGSHM